MGLPDPDPLGAERALEFHLCDGTLFLQVGDWWLRKVAFAGSVPPQETDPARQRECRRTRGCRSPTAPDLARAWPWPPCPRPGSELAPRGAAHAGHAGR